MPAALSYARVTCKSRTMTVEATQAATSQTSLRSLREDAVPAAAAQTARPKIHPLWLRIMHWINAVAIVVMIASGWEIYNASPLFGFAFPRSITLGGWLAG